MPAGGFQLRPIISMLSNVVQFYPMLSNDIQCYLMINNRTNVAKDERSDMGSLPGAESLHDHFFQFI